MKTVDILAWLLVVVGAITWGLIGVFQWNLIDFIFMRITIDHFIYDLIGISAVYLIVRANKLMFSCKKKK